MSPIARHTVQSRLCIANNCECPPVRGSHYCEMHDPDRDQDGQLPKAAAKRYDANRRKLYKPMGDPVKPFKQGSRWDVAFACGKSVGYARGRADGLRKAIEEVKKAGEAEHARLERGWKRGDIVKMTSISIFNSILRRLRRRMATGAASKGEK